MTMLKISPSQKRDQKVGPIAAELEELSLFPIIALGVFSFGIKNAGDNSSLQIFIEETVSIANANIFSFLGSESRFALNNLPTPERINLSEAQHTTTSHPILGRHIKAQNQPVF